jgi:hypothetical protein
MDVTNIAFMAPKQGRADHAPETGSPKGTAFDDAFQAAQGLKAGGEDTRQGHAKTAEAEPTLEESEGSYAAAPDMASTTDADRTPATPPHLGFALVSDHARIQGLAATPEPDDATVSLIPAEPIQATRALSGPSVHLTTPVDNKESPATVPTGNAVSKTSTALGASDRRPAPALLRDTSALVAPSPVVAENDAQATVKTIARPPGQEGFAAATTPAATAPSSVAGHPPETTAIPKGAATDTENAAAASSEKLAANPQTGEPKATQSGSPTQGVSPTQRLDLISQDATEGERAEIPSDPIDPKRTTEAAPSEAPSTERSPSVQTTPPPAMPAVNETVGVAVEVTSDPIIAEVSGTEQMRSDTGRSAGPELQIFNRPETPRLVAQQVADVIRASRDGTLEVTLRPEELGRLSLSFNGDGNTLSVSLSADRPETLDLIKRNLALLEQDLRDLGYDSLNFAFDDGGRRDGQSDESRDAAMAAGQGPAPEDTQPPSANLSAHAARGGVDLRL